MASLVGMLQLRGTRVVVGCLICLKYGVNLGTITLGGVHYIRFLNWIQTLDYFEFNCYWKDNTTCFILIKTNNPPFVSKLKSFQVFTMTCKIYYA